MFLCDRLMTSYLAQKFNASSSLLFTLQYPQHTAQCSAPSSHSIHTYRMKCWSILQCVIWLLHFVNVNLEGRSEECLFSSFWYINMYSWVFGVWKGTEEPVGHQGGKSSQGLGRCLHCSLGSWPNDILLPPASIHLGIPWVLAWIWQEGSEAGRIYKVIVLWQLKAFVASLWVGPGLQFCHCGCIGFGMWSGHH